MKTALQIIIVIILTSCTNNKMGIFDFFKKKEPLISVTQFENENFNNLKDYYEKSILIDGNDIKLDLNFEAKETNNVELNLTNEFIAKLETYDKKNQTEFYNDFTNNAESTIKEYIEHHLDELNNEDVNSIIKDDNSSDSNDKKLLKSLKLKRIGIYPNDKENFAIFDYTIREELTQYLITVYLNSNGEIMDISMES